MTEETAIKVARLDEKVTGQSVQMTRIETKLDDLNTKVDSITVLRAQLESLRLEVADLKKQIATNARRDALTKWVYPTAAAFAGATLYWLIVTAIKSKAR